MLPGGEFVSTTMSALSLLCGYSSAWATPTPRAPCPCHHRYRRSCGAALYACRTTRIHTHASSPSSSLMCSCSSQVRPFTITTLPATWPPHSCPPRLVSAAMSSPAGCEKDPEAALRVNAPAGLLCALSSVAPHCLLVFLSTVGPSHTSIHRGPKPLTERGEKLGCNRLRSIVASGGAGASHDCCPVVFLDGAVCLLGVCRTRCLVGT